MRIEENRVFVFNFDSAEMGGGCSFPIRAASREEAVLVLQRCLGRFNMELSMEFPKTSPSILETIADIADDLISPPVSSSEGLSDVLLERIDSLMKDLGGGDLIDEAKAKTIKLWTEFEYSPQNFAAIVHALELIASGAKKAPIQAKKKA